MISFTSFPPKFEDTDHANTRHHPNVKGDLMDLDDFQKFESQGSKLTCPGESLTSSHAYMRYGPMIRVKTISSN